jgi:hypothetical protein
MCPPLFAVQDLCIGNNDPCICGNWNVRRDVATPSNHDAAKSRKSKLHTDHENLRTEIHSELVIIWTLKKQNISEKKSSFRNACSFRTSDDGKIQKLRIHLFSTAS